MKGLHQIILSLNDRKLELRYPSVLSDDIEILFGAARTNVAAAEQGIRICEESEGRFSLSSREHSATNLSREDLLVALQDRVIHELIVDMKDAVVLHAGAATWNNRAILVAGTTGAGKTALTAWLTGDGFQYLTDEIIVLVDGGTKIVGFPRAMVVKEAAVVAVRELPAFAAMSAVQTATGLMVRPAPQQVAARSPLSCGFIIFPYFEAGMPLRIAPLSAAQTGLRLMGCNLNARNLPGEGFADVVALARTTPAFALHYGDYDQLPGVLDVLIRFLIDSGLDSAATRRFLSAFYTGAVPQSGGTTDNKRDIPAPTPRKPPRKLTIGMATYDDYDGVYFTLQSLRLYHAEVLDDVMFLVVDNHPDGRCAEPLKQLEYDINNYRYVPAAERLGTAVREAVFEEADSEFVLCIDCHVLIVPGAVKRLLSYFTSEPHTRDLLQGPMVHDDLKKLASHFHPAWRGGMYGRWEHDERANDPDGAPFEIPMQGLGLFACRRAIWPGFSKNFHGFGGEEGYIHEKFRRAGGRTLCLPFLRWVHRFNRPMGYPYPNRWDDRIRNYLVGFRELGWPTDGIVEHFREHLGRENADRIFESIEADLAET